MASRIGLPGTIGLIVLLAAGQFEALHAGEPVLRKMQKDPFVVLYPAGAKRIAEFALKALPEILEDVTHRLMVRAPPRVFVSLLHSGEFEKAVGKRRGEWAVAVALSARATILVNLGRLDLRNDLYTTLKHETVHLVLGVVEQHTGRRLPLWFHEGVAQRACERLFAGTREEFLVASRTGNLFPLAEISDAFPLSGAAVNIAYAQAEDFVAFLEDERAEAPAVILARFGRGLSFPDAFGEVFGEKLSSVEARWREKLEGGPPFLVLWMQNNPGALWILIFTGGAVLVFVGYLKVLRRRRELMKRWEEEEP